MADITLCKDMACPERGDCYRAQATANEHRQAYFTTSPRDGLQCTYFWPLHDTINRNPKEKNK